MRLKRNKNYWISLEDQDLITPEETLLDSGSHHSDIEKPISGSIFRVFLGIFSILTILLLALFFKISIIDHGYFAMLAFQNKSANFTLPPPRGMIVDKNSQPLLKNLAIFNLLAVTREIRENETRSQDQIKKIAQILEVEESYISLYLDEQMRLNSTFFIHRDLTKDQALAIEYLEPRGFYIVPDTKREYLDGHKISQIVGYIGKVGREDLQDDNYYFPTDIIGKLGVEYQYEDYLRGQHGNIFFSKEESGYITKAPRPGETVMLNLDHDLQIKLHDSIFNILRESGLSRGAGIIQNPKTGAVLAMVSFPDFDNNIFSSGVSESDYRKLFENPTKPLFNRVISGLYNPGSTIKPLIGMAALQEKIVTPSETITDCISLTVSNPYNPENSYTFNNWRAEYGLFNLRKAIANSCNVYFFSIGGGHEKIKGLGAERIAKYLNLSSADSILGIDLPGENKGFVPTPDWKLREKGEPWYLGDTYNTSIGQGDLSVTPLWLNAYVSAIANGGKIYKPQVVQAILGENNMVNRVFKPEISRTLPFSNEVINEVKMAMRETVISGTAQIMKDLPVNMAAKTGTAEVQKGKTVNSLFTIFGPYEDPDLSMTVLIEGATTQQGLAIRAAHDVLSWYYSDIASK